MNRGVQDSSHSVMPNNNNKEKQTQQKQRKLQQQQKMAVFWDIGPCSLVEIDRHFRDVYYLHHCPDDGSSKYL
jgi:hypothetical protein